MILIKWYNYLHMSYRQIRTDSVFNSEKPLLTESSIDVSWAGAFC